MTSLKVSDSLNPFLRFSFQKYHGMKRTAKTKNNVPSRFFHALRSKIIVTSSKYVIFFFSNNYEKNITYVLVPSNFNKSSPSGMQNPVYILSGMTLIQEKQFY